MNYLAILASAVASMALGWLWFGPLFGKLWLKGMKFESKKMDEMKKGAAKSYVGMVVATLLTFFVLAKLFDTFAIASAASALMLAFWIWLGFVLTVLFGAVLWEGKSSTVFLINAAYYLVNLLLGAWILTLF